MNNHISTFLLMVLVLSSVDLLFKILNNTLLNNTNIDGIGNSDERRDNFE